jgi:transcriptional regulator with XRE-family HTH domain
MKLLQFRKKLGITQSHAARLLGFSLSQIQNYEWGHSRATGKPCPIPEQVTRKMEQLWRQRKEFIAHEDVFLYPGEDWESRVCKEL